MKEGKSVIKRQCISRNHLEDNDNKINMECETKERNTVKELST